MAKVTETQATDPTNEPVAFDDRTRRVMELKKQVREGTYLFDAEAVARAMLGEWIATGDIVLGDEAPPAMETAAERKTVAARFLVASDATPTENVEAVGRSA